MWLGARRTNLSWAFRPAAAPSDGGRDEGRTEPGDYSGATPKAQVTDALYRVAIPSGCGVHHTSARCAGEFTEIRIPVAVAKSLHLPLL